MNRRGFLASMLALAAAPAIVKAENLMKIYVPRDELILPEPLATGFDFGNGDFTVEMWVKPSTEQWNHIAQVHKDGVVLEYVNGVLQPKGTLAESYPGLNIIKRETHHEVSLGTQVEYINDLRVSKGIARNVSKPYPKDTPLEGLSGIGRALGYRA